MANPAAINPNLGEILADDLKVWRAFAYPSYRKRRPAPQPHEARYFAYLLDEEDENDGLSVGLTPRDAVKGLNENHGYCSILVGVVHGLPHGLQVRQDPHDPGHAFICNLPLRSISEIAEAKAIFIARELARLSADVCCEPYHPNGQCAELP
jgi:hypothetical protein